MTAFGDLNGFVLMPPLLRERLIANARETQRREAKGEGHDPQPLVKFFTPDGAAIWLISEMDPRDPDLLFGLCDLGLGDPELGYVSLTELTALRGRLGLKVMRDTLFTPQHTINQYSDLADRSGTLQGLV